MKSAVLKNKKVEIIERKIPDLKGRFGAIIKVDACGLCGSDIVKINHSSPETDDKIVLGHEIVGEIVDINVDVIGNGAKIPFKKGDIVAGGHHFPCFKCKYCLHGNHSMCKTFKETNLEPSGFSEYVYVTEGHLKNTFFKKPDDLSEEEISFLEPLSCCVRAVRRAGLDFNKDNSSYNVLILGLGSIGILMAQAAKSTGAVVYGFDINESRQKFVEKYGVKFDPDIKYDIIFMTSGSNKALDTAVNLIEAGGKIIVFSSISKDDGYKNDDIYYKELTIMGSYSPAPVDLLTSFELLAKRKVKVDNLSTIYPLEKINEAVYDTKCGNILKGYIKL